jgi:periplasmic divalent cation tolerance protein
MVFVGEPMSFIIVVMTAPNKQEARKIVRTLLEERLIACANILDYVHSIFWWKGKIEEEKEVLVLMKSRRSLFKKLSEKATELHSYDVPEILALPIVEGCQLYIDWMKSYLEEPVK